MAATERLHMLRGVSLPIGMPCGRPSDPPDTHGTPSLLDSFVDDGKSMLMSLSRLPPEREEGNREYKLKLVQPSPERLEHLVTQMKWRLAEGNGEALYEIGVADCGRLEGLNDDDLAASLDTLSVMAARNGATIRSVRRKSVECGCAAEVAVSRLPFANSPTETRVAVLGSVDAGKSTLLGVLAHGDLDNGRGRARLNLFRHKHEIQSGRTSCVSHIVIGFDGDGNAMQGGECGGAVTLGGHTGAWDSAALSGSPPTESPRIVACCDLAGHEKYLKTTVSALTGLCLEYALLVVPANCGVSAIAREHLGLAFTLGIPVAIAVTKSDVASENALKKTRTQLATLLGARGTVVFVDATSTSPDIPSVAGEFMERRVTPVFIVSSVSGTNISLLRKFLGCLRHRSPIDSTQPPELRIDDAWNVPDVGVVVSGTLQVGSISPGDTLALGPCDDGSFLRAVVGSIHRQRRPSGGVGAGQMAALSLQGVTRDLVRRGMVLCDPLFELPACFEFEAELLVLCRDAVLAPKYQATVHCRGVRQTACVVRVGADGPTLPLCAGLAGGDCSTSKACKDCREPDGPPQQQQLRHGQRGVVRLRFVRRPECIAVGAPLVLVSSRTKASGVITRIVPCAAGPSCEVANAHATHVCPA